MNSSSKETNYDRSTNLIHGIAAVLGSATDGSDFNSKNSEIPPSNVLAPNHLMANSSDDNNHDSGAPENACSDGDVLSSSIFKGKLRRGKWTVSIQIIQYDNKIMSDNNNMRYHAFYSFLMNQ